MKAINNNEIAELENAVVSIIKTTANIFGSAGSKIIASHI